jgi:hypothetical protein
MKEVEQSAKFVASSGFECRGQHLALQFGKAFAMPQRIVLAYMRKSGKLLAEGFCHGH